MPELRPTPLAPTLLTPTPGQTIGPFFHYALPYDRDRELVPPGNPKAIRLHGKVYDGQGNGVPDAMIEIRQADADGKIPRIEGSRRRDGHTFTGWGRSTTDPNGHYYFSTLLPGSAEPDTAPFIGVTLFARGLLNRLFTRIYLPGLGPDQDEALASDPFLASLSASERAGQIAQREDDGSLRFDIHFQGAAETVFLTYPRHLR